ncbi:MAG: hypothetical protein WAV51_01640 [Microgenomates group bacterium]
MKTNKLFKKKTVNQICLYSSGFFGYLCANKMVFLIEAQPNAPWTNQILTLYILTIILYSIMTFFLIKLEQS